MYNHKNIENIESQKFTSLNFKRTKTIMLFLLTILVTLYCMSGCTSKNKTAAPTDPLVELEPIDSIPQIPAIDWTVEPASFMVDNNNVTIDVGLYAVPDLVDIDNDGDLDLFVGEWMGTIKFYRNTGTAELPEWTLEDAFFESVNFGRSPAPSFADIDDDGDFDLFIGTNYTVGHVAPDGNIVYYMNVGTKDSADFELVTNTVLNFQNKGISKPEFVDFDGDDDLDLIVGFSETDLEGGQVGLAYFQNNGSKTGHCYTLVTKELLGWTNIEGMPSYLFNWVFPSFADIDRDGDLDAILGTHSSIYYYTQDVVGDSVEWSRTNIRSSLGNITQFIYSTELGDLNNDGILDLLVGIGAGSGHDSEKSGQISQAYGKEK